MWPKMLSIHAAYFKVKYFTHEKVIVILKCISRFNFLFAIFFTFTRKNNIPSVYMIKNFLVDNKRTRLSLSQTVFKVIILQMKTLSHGIKIIDTDWSCLSLKPDRECSSWAVTGNTWESLLTCPSYPHCQAYVVPRQEVWHELNLLLATLRVAECEFGLSGWAGLVLMRIGVGNRPCH